MRVEAFSARVQRYLKSCGYPQKELADKVGLHSKVLSRKLHGTENAYLTHQDVRRIILTLVDWHAINTREEVLNLLELADLEPTFLSESDWQAPPLKQLAPPRVVPQTWNSLSSPAIIHNLPAPTTRLIGREWAVGRLKQLLEREDVRLITLVGTGGSGKTRLALHLAREHIPVFPQGVWFVSLVGVNDPEQVPMSIIQALYMTPAPDLSPFQSLLRYLRNKRQLLVLDNFEHLEPARELVAKMLAEAPKLKILVTSRAVLHTYGEYEFSVPPLDIPNPGFSLDFTSLPEYGAVQLFVERAQAVQRDFALTPQNAPIIAQICAHVDGLPLALELAAARVKVLPPDLLLERLAQARLSVLTGGARNLPPKLQTLRNTITWSYNLLSPGAQNSFRHLGIFTGSWSLEAAESMMREIASEEQEDDFTPLDILEQLMDQSLIIRQDHEDRRIRFAMLATLREYAREQLIRHGEMELLRDWHASYYLRKVETAEEKLRGPEQLIWLARLVADHENILAALAWSLQRARERVDIPFLASSDSADSRSWAPSDRSARSLSAQEVCLRMAAALSGYWEWKGYLTEGRHWLLAVLEVPMPEDPGAPLLAARAKALSLAARMVFLQNEKEMAVELSEASIALWQTLDNPSGLAWALLHRSWAAHGMGEYETEKRLCREGLSLLSPETHPWLYAQILIYLAAAHGFTSEFEQTHKCYEQSLAIFERLGDKSAIADLLKDQGGLLILEGNYAEAIDGLLRSIKLCSEMDHKQYITTGMEWLSYAVGLRKVPDPATAAIYSAQLRGFTDALMDEIGMRHWSRTLQFIQVVELHIRSFIDEPTWKAALNQGRSLKLEDAIKLVVQARNDPA